MTGWRVVSPRHRKRRRKTRQQNQDTDIRMNTTNNNLLQPLTIAAAPDASKPVLAYAHVEADFMRRSEPLEVLNLVRELENGVA